MGGGKDFLWCGGYIYQEFNNKLDNEDVKNELFRINDYAQTIDNGAFLIVIIGAVKAGKSTLCNLVADKQIAQTSYKECTLRPMFITKGDGTFTTFRRTSDASESENILFERILSNIIKNEKDKPINGVESSTKPFTKENMVDANKEDPSLFLTSVSVKESELVRDKIVFVDMPGLDGKTAQFDKYQDAILQRADYVIFVQSSTTDITKDSGLVLNEMYKCNPDLVLSIMLNFRDDNYFDKTVDGRKDAKNKLSGYEMQYCITQFSNYKHELSDVINLGILTSYKNGSMDEAYLNKGKEEFIILRDFIQRISNKVTSNADAIRKPRIENNIKKRITSLLTTIVTEIQTRETKINQYDAFAQKYQQLTTSSFLSDNFNVIDKSKEWKLNIDKILSKHKPEALINGKEGHSTIKNVLEEYLNNAKEEIQKGSKNLTNDATESIIKEISEKIILLNNKLSEELGIKTTIKANKIPTIDEPSITKMYSKKYPTVKQILGEDPGFFAKMFRFRYDGKAYNKDEYNRLIDTTENRIIKYTNNLQEELNDYLKEKTDEYIGELLREIKDDIKTQCNNKMHDMIPDYQSYCQKKQDLESLKTQLNTL